MREKFAQGTLSWNCTVLWFIAVAAFLYRWPGGGQWVNKRWHRSSQAFHEERPSRAPSSGLDMFGVVQYTTDVTARTLGMVLKLRSGGDYGDSSASESSSGMKVLWYNSILDNPLTNQITEVWISSSLSPASSLNLFFVETGL
jgi:hypothetical protein